MYVPLRVRRVFNANDSIVLIDFSSELNFERTQFVKSENRKGRDVARFPFAQALVQRLSIDPDTIKRNDLVTGVQSLIIRWCPLEYRPHHQSVSIRGGLEAEKSLFAGMGAIRRRRRDMQSCSIKGRVIVQFLAPMYVPVKEVPQ